MKKLITIVFVGICCVAVQAQTRNCGTMQHLDEIKQNDPQVEQRMQVEESAIQNWIVNSPESLMPNVITIPVVVHIVYKTSAQNLSDNDVYSQIQVLNEDFRKTNPDASSVPSAFSGVAADCEIEFCLAVRDPSGNTTTGITRTNTSSSSFSANDNMKHNSSGGKDAWSTSDYLNIWVCNISGGILGYAQFPSSGSANEDGVVIDYAYFGDISATSPYDKGRTATHEVGHWLNLRHIWGDSNCGNDYVSDTPTQATSNGGCPSFPSTSSCTGNAPNGDMFMNYMDYTYDACMYMFSAGQKTRMRATLNGSRSSLQSSNGCVSVSPCLDNVVIFTGYDSYGDGWNGGTYDVSSGGISLASGGMTTGSSFSDGLCLPTGCYDVTVGGGSWDSEISFDFASLVGSGAGTYIDISVGGAVCPAVSGCTDSTALNYDALANTDDGSCIYCVYGCIDPVANNYSASATCGDGSCTYTPILCINPSPTNAYISELIHDRARVNWDNMNDADCMVDQYRIRYREVGSSTWLSKTMAGSGLCVFGLNTTSKKVLGLSASTTYEYYMKAWYCGGGVSGWSALQNFTTLDLCPNVINFAVSSPSNTKASFIWDSTSAYSFARIKLRPDTTNAVWTTAGGFGVMYPLLTKDKNGLTSGQPYRASVRTWCDPTGGTYRADSWTAPIFWTQPTTIKLAGESLIENLTIYPNPSRDIFNISFTSYTKQDLKVRIMNVIGEELINENLEQFIGEYTKQINLSDNAKGIYFLEIETNDGVINKKLILQ